MAESEEDQLLEQQLALKALLASKPDIPGLDVEATITNKIARIEEQRQLRDKRAQYPILEREKRELQRQADDKRFKHFRSMELKCFARDSPDFDHFTRIVIEKLEFKHKRVQLLFAGFPITGQIASSANNELVLSTTLWFRAESKQALDDMVADIFEALKLEKEKPDKNEPWLAAWAKVVNNKDHKGGIAFENGEWQAEPELQALPPDEEVSDCEEPQEDGDLFIAAPDGEMYLMRKADYEPEGVSPEGGWRDPEARFLVRKGISDGATSETVQSRLRGLNRAAEIQLAQRMIDGGVELAAIPSTGLPTRGTYCYLVNLSPTIPGARRGGT